MQQFVVHSLVVVQRLQLAQNERCRFSLATLTRACYLLEKALRVEIKDCEKQAFERGFQNMLWGPEAVAQTTYDYDFRFDPNIYPAHWYYTGYYQFERHFFPLVGELKSDGEEFEYARAIDQCRQVKHWARNLTTQDSSAFRLPLSLNYFYPDFVAELDDTRMPVVEYKGGHLVEGAQEKQNIGERWEAMSGGKALFLMAVERDSQGRNVRQQIEDKIAGR